MSVHVRPQPKAARPVKVPVGPLGVEQAAAMAPLPDAPQFIVVPAPGPTQVGVNLPLADADVFEIIGRVAVDSLFLETGESLPGESPVKVRFLHTGKDGTTTALCVSTDLSGAAGGFVAEVTGSPKKPLEPPPSTTENVRQTYVLDTGIISVETNDETGTQVGAYLAYVPVSEGATVAAILEGEEEE